MNFAEKVNEMRELQAEIDRMTSSLNKALLESILDENKKVTPTLCDNPPIALVPYSAIMSSPGHILSAEYYLPDSQVDTVRYRINNCIHVDQLCHAVKEMLDTKKVRINGGYVYLNETTLQVLRDSELGQFVTSESSNNISCKTSRL